MRKLSANTGESAQTIIKKGINLYEQSRGRMLHKSDSSKLATIVADPERREAFQDVMSLLGKRSLTTMTKAQRKERARHAALARAEKLTAARRKEIAALGGSLSRKGRNKPEEKPD